jgi:alkylation response protein AidB-like acyl-CoA dehydrogenase
MSISMRGVGPADAPIDDHPLCLGSLDDFRSALCAWLDSKAGELLPLFAPRPDFEERVQAARLLQRMLYDAGWSRFGWPSWAGGLGGNALHRGVVHEELCDRGWPGPSIFEHLEIVAPTLLAFAQPSFLADVLPAFINGSRSWAQGFSEPESGSDLASLRTRGVVDGERIIITGQKIWTSWAKWADSCLALVRTGTATERHRGLTMVAIPLDAPGVDVRPIRQVNGTEELAEVFFDQVEVPLDHVVGEIGGGWTVAMHLLAHERGTLAWFRHCHFGHRLAQGAALADPEEDTSLGAAVVQLAGLRATAGRQLALDASGGELGPPTAYTKLLMTRCEQQLYDTLLRIHGPAMELGLGDPDDQLLHQEYLFSRVVTIYGGSEQMQLMTLANRVLRMKT